MIHKCNKNRAKVFNVWTLINKIFNVWTNIVIRIFVYILYIVIDLLVYSVQTFYYTSDKKKNKMGKYLLCFSLVLLSFDSINSYLMPPLFRKFNVEIVNQLGFDKKLKVHCKSGSHDFPITYLNIGENFQFKFTIKLKTLYWCNLWQVRYTHFQYMQCI